MATAPTTAEQPGGTGKPMTPAERARHASLVRWGKEQPFAARLAALRGKRRGREKAGGKGKTVKTPEQRQTEKDTNRENVLRSFNIASDGAAALAALREGNQPDDPKTIASHGFVEAGLVEKASDGSYRLSASGRAMLRAAEAGDKGRAGDIISSARDRTGARTERQARAEERRKARETKRGKGSDTDKAAGAFGRMEHAAKAQTAEDRAMFANMGGGGGSGGGGGGAGGGGKAPTLWNKNPKTGKREPGMGLEHENVFGPAYTARQAELAKGGGIEGQLARERASREQFFRSQTATVSGPTEPRIVKQNVPPLNTGAVVHTQESSTPERYRELEAATERVKMPQAGWNAPMSDKQQGYLGSLLDRARLNTKEGSGQRALADELVRMAKGGKLTKWEASQFIDAMRAPKPLTTLLQRARDGIMHGDSEQAAWRALLASPRIRHDLINHALAERAKAEGLPF